MNKAYKINLLFNANKIYDRQVIEGIGEYLHANQSNWDIYIEDDFTTNLENIKNWQGDGVIADLDNPDILAAVQHLNCPVVGVGGSYANQDDYPLFPYVATDNHALVSVALEHLKAKGLEQFAFYGFPETPYYQWAKERLDAFVHLTQSQGYTGLTFRGNDTKSETWHHDMNRLADWIERLPTPIGIIAATDSRARHLLQVCAQLGIMVPDKIAVIGIDNEEITRYLSRVSLSSVGQGCQEMGYQAAKMLDQQLMLDEKPNYTTDNIPPRLIVPPTQVFERQSTDFQSLTDSYVIQAMHFIRQNACRGIKVEQVLDQVKISRSNLETRFKVALGHSIHHEIHFSKLKQACHLLKTTKLSINEIAQACGYPSTQYMYSVFKKELAVTPKGFREQP